MLYFRQISAGFVLYCRNGHVGDCGTSWTHRSLPPTHNSISRLQRLGSGPPFGFCAKNLIVVTKGNDDGLRRTLSNFYKVSYTSHSMYMFGFDVTYSFDLKSLASSNESHMPLPWKLFLDLFL